VRFDELKPSRFERACLAAALGGGVLRLSAAGMAADAPEVFRTVREAEGWLEREGREAIKYPRAPNVSNITGAGVLNGVRVHLRLKGQRGKATPALVFGSGDPRAVAEVRLGELAAFEVVQAPEPVSTMQETLPEPTHALPKRLVRLPPGRQIKSSMLAAWLAERLSGDLPASYRRCSRWKVPKGDGRPWLVALGGNLNAGARSLKAANGIAFQLAG
jgi:hypothetical protein